MVSCRECGWCVTVTPTFMYVHLRVYSIYESYDGFCIGCIIGVQYVRAIGIHIQGDVVVSE